MATRRSTRLSSKTELKTEAKPEIKTDAKPQTKPEAKKKKPLPKKKPDVEQLNMSEDDEADQQPVKAEPSPVPAPPSPPSPPPPVEEEEKLVKNTRPARAARQRKPAKREEEILSEKEEPEETEKRPTDKKAKPRAKNGKKLAVSAQDNKKAQESMAPADKHQSARVVPADDNGSPEPVYELDEREMKDVNAAFDFHCSNDADELLGSEDLKNAIRRLGFEPRGDEIKRLLKKYANKKGKVNRDGFHKIMALKMSNSPGFNDNQNDEISRVFNLLDLEKKGYITVEDLKSISKELNENITEEELLEMIQEADLDGDSKINKTEFHNIMKKTSLY